MTCFLTMCSLHFCSLVQWFSRILLCGASRWSKCWPLCPKTQWKTGSWIKPGQFFDVILNIYSFIFNAFLTAIYNYCFIMNLHLYWQFNTDFLFLYISYVIKQYLIVHWTVDSGAQLVLVLLCCNTNWSFRSQYNTWLSFFSEHTRFLLI